MGVVRDGEGRVLLVRTHRRDWEPPGGQVELGEDLVSALKREVEEESACRVEVGRLVGVYSNTGERPQVIFAFLCAYVGGDPRPSEETPEVGWFSPEDALRLVTHPAQLGRLRDALAFSGELIYRWYRTHPYELYGERSI
jgi:8-oxo-dGTP diphosphatase